MNWLKRALLWLQPFAPRPEDDGPEARPKDDGPEARPKDGSLFGWDVGAPEGDKTVVLEMDNGSLIRLHVREPEEKLRGMEKSPLEEGAIARAKRADVGTSQFQEDDDFHDVVAHGFNHGLVSGEIDTHVNFEKRFRISWLCNRCNKMHFQGGDLMQVMDTFGMFLQMKYPYVRVEDMAFVEHCAMGGKNVHEEPEACAKSYLEMMEGLTPDT